MEYNTFENMMNKYKQENESSIYEFAKTLYLVGNFVATLTIIYILIT